ncbi:hypothetical protein GN956_G22897 [Arapaima gigas]
MRTINGPRKLSSDAIGAPQRALLLLSLSPPGTGTAASAGHFGEYQRSGLRGFVRAAWEWIEWEPSPSPNRTSGGALVRSLFLRRITQSCSVTIVEVARAVVRCSRTPRSLLQGTHARTHSARMVGAERQRAETDVILR